MKILTGGKDYWMDDKKDGTSLIQKDPPPEKKHHPKQLQTNSMFVNFVEDYNSTN